MAFTPGFAMSRRGCAPSSMVRALGTREVERAGLKYVEQVPQLRRLHAGVALLRVCKDRTWIVVKLVNEMDKERPGQASSRRAIPGLAFHP